ncbi:MAG: FAD-dependent monooxygenase, partial [Chthoniobacterales bacterium]
FCARAGLRVVLLEREKFPREKVCGDCLNPSVWPVLKRLALSDRVRALPHGTLECVDFIAVHGQVLRVALPIGDQAEIAVKRSAFDQLLLTRARELGADVREAVIVSSITKCKSQAAEWSIKGGEETFAARVLVGADGRNSSVARLCNLFPRIRRDRVALQTHLPLPADFGNRVVLQFLPGGYSGQAPVDTHSLNVCLVSNAKQMPDLRKWAAARFGIPRDHSWRTITPLTRAPLPAGHDHLFLVGDAARVVEPFTGEGIYYALRSGELAAEAIIAARDRSAGAARRFTSAHARLYRDRLWVNRLARAAVLHPRVTSALFPLSAVRPQLLRLLTAKIVC